MSHLLLVEDNDLNRDMLQRRLERRQFVVTAVASAEEALARIATLQPDLVLMDVGLPGIDGLEATRRLKSDPLTQAIPVIVLTAFAMMSDEEQSRAAGSDDFDTKPIDFERLCAKIARALHRDPPP
ncbi:MAG: response regulator [bacterium]